MDIILRLFSLAGIFVSFGEGVWRKRARVSTSTPLNKENVAQIQVEQKPPEMLIMMVEHRSSTECGHIALTRGDVGNTPDLEKERWWQNDLPKVLRFSMDINSAFSGERPLKANKIEKES